MSQEYSRKLEDTDIEVGAQDPLHEEPAITRASYGPIDHLSHVTGIAVSTFYLVAAVATLYEVISRYLFNAPTYWAFETVMMLCATAWMLSSGYITLKKRHIGITVLHVMASERQRWWLDLFAMIVGVMNKPRLWSEGTGHSVHPGAQGRIHQVGIAQGSLHLAVTQKLSDHFQRCPATDKKRCEGVAQVMDPDVLQPALLLDLRPEAADLLHRLAGRIAGKEPR